MICIHCGKNIPFDAQICPECKKDTEVGSRFRYVPSRAPIPTAENGAHIAVLPSLEDPKSEPDPIPLEEAEPFPEPTPPPIVIDPEPDRGRSGKMIPILAGIIVLLLVGLFLSLRTINHLREDISTVSEPASSEISLPEDLDGQEIPEEPVSGVEKPSSAPILTFSPNLPKDLQIDVSHSPETKAYTLGMAAPGAPLELQGYDFLGWCIDWGGKDTIIKQGAKIPLITEDATFYAIWRSIAPDDPTQA